jgi:ethanolamine utilization protein EutN
MELAKVDGSVVATVKVDRLVGHKLLLVTLIRADMTPTDTNLVAIDTVGAGVGEIVLVVRGSSARQTDKTATVPTDTTIVGIIDVIVYHGKSVYEKALNSENGNVSGKN